jgi:WD40 repeat protein
VWRLPSRRWRSAFLKVAAAVAIAGLAVAYQESLPRPAARDAGVTASQRADVPAPLHLTGHQGSVVAAAASDQGRWIVSAGADATLRIWNATSGALVRTVPLDEGAVTALAVDDQRALTGHGSGAIVLWDLEHAEKLATFQHGSGAIAALAFADGDTFAAAAQDGSVGLFDIRAPAAPAVLLDGRATMAATAPGQGLLAAADHDTVQVWRTATAVLARSFRNNGGDITALALSPDGRSLAAAATDGSIRVWRISTGRQTRMLRTGQGRRYAALALGPDGMLAAAGEDGRVKLWNQGRTARTLDGGPAHSLSFSPDGLRLIGAGQDGVIRVWTLAASLGRASRPEAAARAPG